MHLFGGSQLPGQLRCQKIRACLKSPLVGWWDIVAQAGILNGERNDVGVAQERVRSTLNLGHANVLLVIKVGSIGCRHFAQRAWTYRKFVEAPVRIAFVSESGLGSCFPLASVRIPGWLRTERDTNADFARALAYGVCRDVVKPKAYRSLATPLTADNGSRVGCIVEMGYP